LGAISLADMAETQTRTTSRLPFRSEQSIAS
jgi:hypothetical protein